MSVRYKIDSVSNLYPALGGLVYRLCAVLAEPVQKEILHRALTENLPVRFPIMCSHLERTFFSYCHVPATDYDVISDGEPFFQRPDMFDTEKPSFRLAVRDNRIIMDVFHGNGDGGAGIEFLKALVTDYLLLCKGEPPVPAVPPRAEDLEDPYVKYYKRARSASLLEKGSYQLHLTPSESDWYARFSCISVDLAQAKAYTKSLNCTINDLLCGALAYVIIQETDAKEATVPVTISAPIDLRKHYNSHSQRNFAFYSNMRIQAADAVDLETAVQRVHTLMQAATSKEALRRGVAAAYKAANNPAVQWSPRALREFIVRKAYCHVTGGGITTTLSNIGYHTLSEEIADGLERFEMYLGPGRGSINAAAVGVGDSTSLCITCGSEETVIEDAVEAVLHAHGIATVRHSFAYRFKNREPSFEVIEN